MNRKEAEKLAKRVFETPPLRFSDSDPPPPTIFESVTDAILSAYRKGETDMREKCAKVAERRGAARMYGPGRDQAVVIAMHNAIRAVPLTDEESDGQSE